MRSASCSPSSRVLGSAPSRVSRRRVHRLERAVGWRSTVAIAIALGLAAAAGAEIRHLEVVGAIALDANTRRIGLPKERAIEQALWEGVSRVAADLLVESELPEGEEGSNPLRTALGSDMVPYTRSFRILEDQGERPALFSESEEAATEYVVVVEVKVDVDRVRERLELVGLLQVDGTASELMGIWIEVQGLTLYQGYEALMALLMDDRVGVSSVVPVEFERGKSLLKVEAEWGASELLERMLASAPPGLRITALAVRGSRSSNSKGLSVWRARRESLTLAVSWMPPPPETDPDEEMPDEPFRGDE